MSNNKSQAEKILQKVRIPAGILWESFSLTGKKFSML